MSMAGAVHGQKTHIAVFPGLLRLDDFPLCGLVLKKASAAEFVHLHTVSHLTRLSLTAYQPYSPALQGL
jgi:hypothetical protein